MIRAMRMNPRLRERVEMMTPPLPWDRARWTVMEGPSVVLLHGLWRGWRAMEPLARALRSEGFATLNIPYPSTRLPIPALADHVRREVEKIANRGPVHFITHSLGGIVARLMLSGPLPWTPGRLVMLAPPNAGSEIVDWSAGKPLIRRLLGPAGRELSSNGLPSALPALPEGMEAAVIMGNRSSIPAFKKLLEKDNDGIVSASRGKIDGLRGYSVIDADHTFIQVHPDAIRLCLGFLKTGSWDA